MKAFAPPVVIFGVFGYGLSYTTFAYQNLNLSAPNMDFGFTSELRSITDSNQTLRHVGFAPDSETRMRQTQAFKWRANQSIACRELSANPDS
jgi:hypothetical protein